MFFTAFLNLTFDVLFPCHIFFLDCLVCLLPNMFLTFFVFSDTNLYLIKVENRTDKNDRPYITHGKVSEMSIFLLPDLLQQRMTISLDVGSDWLNWCIGPSDWLAKI